MCLGFFISHLAPKSQAVRDSPSRTASGKDGALSFLFFLLGLHRPVLNSVIISFQTLVAQATTLFAL